MIILKYRLCKISGSTEEGKGYIFSEKTVILLKNTIKFYEFIKSNILGYQLRYN
jgi:hypothetical protein